ncbi:hypothetical protein [Streptomyces jeddahensis]|uniref:hypothetical protein n=1 Tax=Streptomyces jeddahensis TaxID=1716141 RepID=UPI00082FE58F|nr:hypothetical protein [Streptomyces jeddahensis]
MANGRSSTGWSTRSAQESLLDADVLVTLAPTEDRAKVQVTVAERDFGVISAAYLRPDLLHARFLDAGAVPAGRTSAEGPVQGLGGGAVERELAEAALPYTSVAQQGLPASVTHVLAATPQPSRNSGFPSL